MNYRVLGRTNFKVSEIGFGAWGIGAAQWIGAEDQVSLKALKAARDAGINFFDTALAYGNGHSERLIAQAFGDERSPAFADLYRMASDNAAIARAMLELEGPQRAD